MIKNKKGILFLVIILLIFYISISIIISIMNEYKNTVFIGDNTKVEVNDGNIKIYNDNTKINEQNVKILFKDDFIDGYITSKHVDSTGVENSYIAHNENGEIILFDNVLIAHTKDLSLNIKKTTITEIKNINDISEFLKQNNINISSKEELDYYNKNTIDENESIYSIGININNEIYKSYIFMKKENKYILLSSEENKYTDIDNIRLNFVKLIDFNDDNNYEFVINKSMSEYGPNYYELYNFDGNEFTEIGVEK